MDKIIKELNQLKIEYIDLKGSEKLWNIESQKRLLGPFYKEKVKVPFHQDKNTIKPTSIYN